jgi:hypothetical protein
MAAKTWKDWANVTRGKYLTNQSPKTGDILVGIRECNVGGSVTTRRVYQSTDGRTFIHHYRGFRVYGTLFQGVFSASSI